MLNHYKVFCLIKEDFLVSSLSVSFFQDRRLAFIITPDFMK